MPKLDTYRFVDECLTNLLKMDDDKRKSVLAYIQELSVGRNGAVSNTKPVGLINFVVVHEGERLGKWSMVYRDGPDVEAKLTLYQAQSLIFHLKQIIAASAAHPAPAEPPADPVPGALTFSLTGDFDKPKGKIILPYLHGPSVNIALSYEQARKFMEVFKAFIKDVPRGRHLVHDVTVDLHLK